jgi:hypothetical protein
MNREILIAVYSVPDLQKAVNTLARAAKKLSLSPIPELHVDWASKKEIERTVVTTLLADGDEMGSSTMECVEVVKATVTLPDDGVTAKGDWRMVGKLTATEEGLETQAFNAADLEILAKFREAGRMDCAHCRANRYRTVTLVIRSNAGEIRQVGRECGEHYLTDLAQALGSLEFRELVESLIRVSDEDGGYLEYGSGPGRRLRAFDLETALSVIIRHIRCHGFQKSKFALKDGDYGRAEPNPSATWRLAVMSLTDEKMMKAHLPTEADVARAKALIDWISNLAVNPTENEFLANLQDIVRSGFVSERKIALLAALPAAKDRADQEAARKNLTIPAPEGRQVVEGVLVKQEERENDFGITWKMLVQLDNGCRVWCSVPSGCNVVEGGRIKFKATFVRSDRDQFFAFGSRPLMVK